MTEQRCPLTRQVIRAWKRFALSHPWQGNRPLMDRRHAIDTTCILEPGRPIRLMLSFDVGYHGSGWFANSEWEQNLHLSLSHPKVDAPLEPKKAMPEIGIPEGTVGYQLETVSDEEARSWGQVIFGEDAPKAWFEPAASVLDIHRAPNVVHLRLFYDEHMRPFMPEGEPYSLRPWTDGTSPEKVYGRNRAT